MRNSFIAALLGLFAVAAAAQGQSFPAKPVRFMVGFAPGGASDITARVVAQKMGEIWAQTVIVENRPGASGIIGADAVAKAPPDGHLLLVTSQTSTAVATSLYSKLPYDVLKDFTIVSVIGSTATILAVHPSVPAKTFPQFVLLAKTAPQSMSFASSGFGSVSHFGGELLGLALKVKMVPIPYKGESPALTDVIGGQLPFMFGSLPLAMPHIKAGKLRGLAVTSLQRSPIASEYPTVVESGIPDFEMVAWQGLYGPASLPKELVARINADITRALQTPDVNERLTQQGIDRVANTPEQASAYLKTEIAKYAKIVKSANLRVD